jgi:phosphoglycerate dehydrogenase-like enzyme
MLGEPLFRAMRSGATFINTGRGATVDEKALIRVFGANPSLTALLDVTYPEPPVESSPLFDLPNVFLTSHIAGAAGDEVVRMADLCIEEFEAWTEGKPLRYAVTPDMLDRMA